MTKATSVYLSSIGGKFSKSKLSDQDRMAGMNKDASNNILESNHASSTHSLKTSGTIRINSAAGEGQTRANNDFGRGHQAMVTAKAGLLEYLLWDSYHMQRLSKQLKITSKHPKM